MQVYLNRRRFLNAAFGGLVLSGCIEIPKSPRYLITPLELPTVGQRYSLMINNLELSYLDFGGGGKPVIMLHGLFGCARGYASVASALRPDWRVMALDLRGHGWTGQATDFSRQAYIFDVAAFINLLGLAPAIVIGHSMGGMTAYQLAARHPDLVKAVVNEEGPLYSNLEPEKLMAGWPERFDDIQAMRDFLVREVGSPAYFMESAVEYADGWGFRFHYDNMREALKNCLMDFSEDWRAVTCPTLLLRGQNTWALPAEQTDIMRSLRPSVEFHEVPNASHTIHRDNPDAFIVLIKDFLARHG